MIVTLKANIQLKNIYQEMENLVIYLTNVTVERNNLIMINIFSEKILKIFIMMTWVRTIHQM